MVNKNYIFEDCSISTVYSELSCRVDHSVELTFGRTPLSLHCCQCPGVVLDRLLDTAQEGAGEVVDQEAVAKEEGEQEKQELGKVQEQEQGQSGGERAGGGENREELRGVLSKVNCQGGGNDCRGREEGGEQEEGCGGLS